MTHGNELTLSFARKPLAKNTADRLTDDYTSPIIPAKEIAEMNGVEVVLADFGRFADKVAGLCDFTKEKLFINVEDHPTRQMFTVAHELGHWILHKDYFRNDPSSYSVLPRFSAPKSDPFEREANIFAANLLVPDKLLKPVKNSDPADLARVFGVSRQMMEIRLREIACRLVTGRNSVGPTQEFSAIH